MPDIPIEVDCRSVKAALDASEDFLLLDCREPAEYATAHIAAAMLIPMAEIPARTAELGDQSRRIVVHCHHGGRSLRVANWLRGQGFANAQSMAGGIDEWSQDIDPTVPRY